MSENPFLRSKEQSKSDNRFSALDYNNQQPKKLPLKDLEKWEKHTKGVGRKLLDKFGFTGRLGAHEDGISKAIEVTIRPDGMGLGFCNFKEKKQTHRQNDKPRNDKPFASARYNNNNENQQEFTGFKSKEIKFTVNELSFPSLLPINDTDTVTDTVTNTNSINFKEALNEIDQTQRQEDNNFNPGWIKIYNVNGKITVIDNDETYEETKTENIHNEMNKVIQNIKQIMTTFMEKMHTTIYTI